VGTITQHCGGRGLIIEGSSTVIIGEQTPILEPVVLTQAAPAQSPASVVTSKARTPAVPTPPTPPAPAPAATTSAGQTSQGSTTPRSTPTPKPELVLGLFFDGTDNNMLADPPEKHTNVAKLWGLYNSETTNSFVRIPIYIQGVGTKAVYVAGGGVEKNTSVLGLAMGLGPYGADGRLKEARQKLIKHLKDFISAYGGPPETVIFDVFGFSRGAMLARHFVNMVSDGLPDLKCDPKEVRPVIQPCLRQTIKRIPQDPSDPTAPAEVPALFPRLNAKVRVRFLGIFDSVGSFYMAGNADEGFVNPHLAADSAELIYHPVARNEIRHYFPLTSICPSIQSPPANFVEEMFYGAHSDVGGGYDSQPERVLVLDEVEPPAISREYSSWNDRMRAKARANGWTLELRNGHAYFFELRHTRPELSRVALRAMHAKAAAQGVPLRKIDSKDFVPADLESLVARASGGDAIAEQQMAGQFIHTSHNPFEPSNVPEENGKRRIFPNQPAKAIRVVSVQAARKHP
ncbi:MAG: DUF2235 domain-containing protein, partial [Desulfobacteraceae bacterium]|nr:DUF2235 domain-containing protein [Desulfobacteraceae bacterium]